MIEPQVHNAQRGIIGQQHGLQKLTETLEALSAGQKQQQQRDTTIQAHLTTQATQIAGLAATGKRLILVVVGLGILTLGLCGLVGWQWLHPPDMGYARITGALDQALVQQWSSLPKGTQDALNCIYTRLGIQPPGQRK